jgi:hypothetical protein
MSTTPVASPEAPTPGPISPFGRLFGVLFNPKATLQDIASRPAASWVLPLVLMVVLGLVISGLLNKKVDWESFARQQAERSSRFAQLPEAQKQQAVSRQARISPYVSYAVGLLRFPVIVLIASVLYLGAFNMFSGASLRFGQAFAITTYANAGPGLIASLLIIITLAVKAHGDVNPETMLASHLGAFMSSDVPAWQRALGSSIELFDLWGNVLAAVGFTIASPRKISKAGAFGTVFGLWLLWILIKVGLTAVFS